MKKMTKRNGFTIVELVIVIAVIAVLAGVLIPTFGGIIERAHESNDNQVVATVNKLLVVDNIIKGDDPNDAVEIKNMLKDNGVNLKTQSEGKYIWYDIAQNKVILAGLDATGIVFLNDNDKDPNASETKGKFKGATAPEMFVDGYIFLSEESDDGLAQAICSLRNPADATAINDSLENIGKINTTLAGKLTDLMKKTVVLTENAGAITIGEAKDVTTVIVSPDKTKLTETDITSMNAYENIIIVELHSDIVEMDAAAVEAVKTKTTKFFIYSNDEIKTKYDTPDIKYLLDKNERGKYIGDITIVFLYGENQIGSTTASGSGFIKEEGIFRYNFPFMEDVTKGTQLYAFVGYKSFEIDKSVVCNLDDAILDENGNPIIYANFETATADFKVDSGATYSSRYMTYMLTKKMITSGTITVISKTATLGNETYKNLTLPEGVTLLVPFKADKTMNETVTSISGGDYTKETLKEINHETGKGATQLTIPSDVTLNVEKNATIYVDAQIYYFSTPTQGYLKENDCGVLVLNGTIKSEGNITAYGIIRGNGVITAPENATTGGTIIELMTIYDWHGGTNAAHAVGAYDDGLIGTAAALAFPGKNVVPFNNWKLNNIRVKTTINDKTTYNGLLAIAISNTVVVKDYALVAPTGSDALFITSAGAEVEKSIVKDANGIKNGNSKLTIKKGTVNDKAMSLLLNDAVSAYGFSVSAMIDFTKIPMPISHLDIDVASDAELTLSGNLYKLLPGSTVTVDGIMNINTKVVICESFERYHKNPIVSISSEQRWKYTITSLYINDSGELCYEGSRVKQKYSNGLFGLGAGWNDVRNSTESVSGKYSELTIEAAIPSYIQYPINTPAKLIINNTLKFNTISGKTATFAGAILSGSDTATISVENGTVSGYVFPEGYTNGTGTSGVWYELVISDMYSKAMLGGTLGETELSGKYNSNYSKNGDVINQSWKR